MCRTWLLRRIMFRLPKYDIIRSDREITRGGGVCIFIKEDLRYIEIAVQNLSFQYNTLEIPVQNNSTFL